MHEHVKNTERERHRNRARERRIELLRFSPISMWFYNFEPFTLSLAIRCVCLHFPVWFQHTICKFYDTFDASHVRVPRLISFTQYTLQHSKDDGTAQLIKFAHDLSGSWLTRHRCNSTACIGIHDGKCVHRNQLGWLSVCVVVTLFRVGFPYISLCRFSFLYYLWCVWLCVACLMLGFNSYCFSAIKLN